MKQLKFNHDENMKKLEKYGFKLNKYNQYVKEKEIIIPCYCYSCECGNSNHNKRKIIETFYVEKNNIFGRVGHGGKYEYYYNKVDNEDFVLIYDLIKANLLIVESDEEEIKSIVTKEKYVVGD